MAFAASDPTYAATLLTHARQLYTFAETAPQREYETCAPVGGIYESWSGFRDELVFGAIWLSRATTGTESANYLAKAETGYANLPREEGTTLPKYKWTFDWDDKTIASEILLAKLTGKAQYITDASRWIDYTTDRTNGYNGQKATYSPGGQIFYLNWGSLRYAAGSAFLAFVAADSGRFDAARNQRLVDFAEKQTNYALGDNPSNLSYMVGFSKNGGAWVRRPHHRTEHGSWTDQVYEPVESRHTLYGALVGGPPAADDNYGAEDRNKYDKAEVALDFNAPLVGNLARMYSRYGGAPLATFPPTEAPDGPEMYIEGTINQQGTQPGPYLEVKAFVRNKSAWPARHLDNGNFRYYFTLDAGVQPSQVTVTTAYNQCSAPTGPTQFSGNVYYIAVSCAGQRISPRGQSDWRREVQFRIAFPAGSTHNFTQDWSYLGIGTSSTVLGQMPQVQLFSGTTSVWGTAPGTVNPGTPPGAPGQPTASNVTPAAVTLTWTAAAPGTNPIAGYDVYRVGVPDAVVASTTTALTTTVTGLSPATAYTFYVRARDTAGVSGAVSASRTVTTGDCHAADGAGYSDRARCHGDQREPGLDRVGRRQQPHRRLRRAPGGRRRGHHRGHPDVDGGNHHRADPGHGVQLLHPGPRQPGPALDVVCVHIGHHAAREHRGVHRDLRLHQHLGHRRHGEHHDCEQRHDRYQRVDIGVRLPQRPDHRSTRLARDLDPVRRERHRHQPVLERHDRGQRLDLGRIQPQPQRHEHQAHGLHPQRAGLHGRLIKRASRSDLASSAEQSTVRMPVPAPASGPQIRRGRVGQRPPPPP